jgi:hypothetical protein
MKHRPQPLYFGVCMVTLFVGADEVVATSVRATSPTAIATTPLFNRI